MPFRSYPPSILQDQTANRINESYNTDGDVAADTAQDMSLEQQKSVRALVKALGAIAAPLRRVPLDDEKQACRELTDILHAVRAIANAVTP